MAAVHEKSRSVGASRHSVTPLTRRHWLVLAGGACAALGPLDALAFAQGGGKKEEDEDISPTEDLMREHGIRQICTRDTDFHRFPFLQVIDPLPLA